MEFPKGVDELMAWAVTEATSAKAEAVEPAHLFVAACKIGQSRLAEALRAEGIEPVTLYRRIRDAAYGNSTKAEGGPARVSGRVWRILDNAIGRAEAFKREYQTTEVMISLLKHPDSSLRKAFESENLPVDNLVVFLEKSDSTSAAVEPTLLVDTSPTIPPSSRPQTPTIDRFGKDYTALARAGKFDPVIGRRDEIKQVVRMLLQKQKNSPVLVGEAGVGKTSVIEGLALKLAAEDAPADLREWRIVELVLSSLVAGTTFRGEFEERLQQVIKEAESDPQLIIFLDELHTLVGAGSVGGSLDASNILKPALARGRIRMIGATTPDEYRKHIESDSALERRFQPVRIAEPTPEQAREILDGLRGTYEAHHHLEITNEALDAAVELSVKHLPDRKLPDKARDLIDRAAVAKRFLSFTPGLPANPDQQRVTRDDVAQVVAQWTGIPVERLTTNEQLRLLGMEDALRKRVVGQDHAIKALAQQVRTAMSGLSDPARPYGVFLFTGPTGVGKTELAKALAEFLFDDERKLIRFDMSEYMEKHSVSKLIGSPPGYIGHAEGGRLTDAVHENPYSVLLFDEVEKAHPQVSDIFLQIFDDGRLTDSHGRTADFRHTVIILTTNFKGEEERRAIPGFHSSGAEGKGSSVELSAEAMRHQLLARFRPELVNRISHVIPFHSLGETEIRAIIDKLVARIQQRLGGQQIDLQLAPAAYEALMKIGYKPEWGAREMERVIEERIVQPLARGLMAGQFASGEKIFVITAADGLALSKEEQRVKI